MARYIAPLSIYTYPSFLANCLARVLLPQEDQPSIVIIILFDVDFAINRMQKWRYSPDMQNYPYNSLPSLC